MGWCVGGWFRGERDEMDGLRLKLGMNSFIIIADFSFVGWACFFVFGALDGMWNQKVHIRNGPFILVEWEKGTERTTDDKHVRSC